MSSAALASSSSAFASRRVARAVVARAPRRASPRRRRRALVVESHNVSPGASSDGGDADADARRRDERTDDVARAVLEFHAAEGNGNGARGRGGERVVPLASFARRYGWSESRAEGVLWQSDVPARAFGVLPVADEDGTSTGAARAARTVDAAVAYEGMWRTFVETDAVVDALARATARGDGDGDGDGARKPARGHLTKRRAFDDALASLRRDHPASCFPEGGASLAAGASSTTARWNEFLRALRRRYGASASAWPFALLTKKIKRRRVYACAAAASFDAEGWTAAGWDVVLRGDARVERGGFGVRGGIGRGGSDASPVAAAKAAVAAASEAGGGGGERVRERRRGASGGARSDGRAAGSRGRRRGRSWRRRRRGRRLSRRRRREKKRRKRKRRRRRRRKRRRGDGRRRRDRREEQRRRARHDARGASTPRASGRVVMRAPRRKVHPKCASTSALLERRKRTLCSVRLVAFVGARVPVAPRRRRVLSARALFAVAVVIFVAIVAIVVVVVSPRPRSPSLASSRPLASPPRPRGT